MYIIVYIYIILFLSSKFDGDRLAAVFFAKDNMMEDYREDPRLDAYDPELIDDEAHEPMSAPVRIASSFALTGAEHLAHGYECGRVWTKTTNTFQVLKRVVQDVLRGVVDDDFCYNPSGTLRVYRGLQQSGMP